MTPRVGLSICLNNGDILPNMSPLWYISLQKLSDLDFDL